MVRITQIELVNYRSYYDYHKIPITDGKNLLIYGENGSGKSSLYEGLKNFYAASDATKIVRLSRHLKIPESYEDNEGNTLSSEVAVKVTYQIDNGNTLTKIFGIPNSDVVGDATISDYRLQSVFLSYRELLKTHLMDNLYEVEEFKKKFTNLIITEILANKINPAIGRTYERTWAELNVKGRGSRPNREEKERLLEPFYLGFDEDIKVINLHINNLLSYFDPHLNISFSLYAAEIVYTWYNHPEFYTSFDFTMDGDSLLNNNETHLSILNEARLSALAISIFLAGVITANQPQAEQKLLFLDDIFIGLDMSNRLPLLKILNEYKCPLFEERVNEESGEIENVISKDGEGNIVYEAVPFFSQYQTFITTYDRHWFEIAKQFLPNTWHSIEMYSHYDDEAEFDIPLILHESLSYYEKAELYFKKSKDYKDYPAAANYLRKACEQELKRILYGKYLLKPDKDGGVKLKEELGELTQGFKALIMDLKMDTTPYKDFEKITKTTLNPFSHDTQDKPLYKRELVDAFALVGELRKLSHKPFLKKGKKITLTTINNGIERLTTCEISSDVLLFNQNGVKKPTRISLLPLNYIENEVETPLSKLKEVTVTKAYDMVYHSIFNTSNASNGKDILTEFKNESGRTLRELIDET